MADERLTKRRENNYACWNGNQNYNTPRRYLDLLDRLALYEDIGTPAEFAGSLAENARLRLLNDELHRQLATYILTHSGVGTTASSELIISTDGERRSG